MWQKFSLRTRINLLLALVLALGLAANIARLVLEAGPRVQAEDQSVVRLAREFIDTIVAGLNEAPDAEARLNQIVDDLNRLRHVSITRQGEGAQMSGAASDTGDHPGARSPPAWFVALVHPEKTTKSVPIWSWVIIPSQISAISSFGCEVISSEPGLPLIEIGTFTVVCSG